MSMTNFKTSFGIILFLFFLSCGFPLMAQAPSATTDAATEVGATIATLNGTVNANGLSTTVTFEYGLTVEYGQTVTAIPSPVTGSTNTPVAVPMTGLNPLTTYHYRVVATSTGGTTYGNDMTFDTTQSSGSAPIAVTEDATGVGADFATLNGQVHTFNVSAVVVFQWGTDTNYGNSITADQSPLTSSTATPVSVQLTGLANNTTYHYRAVASSANGISYGGDKSFTIGTVSSAPTVTTNAATGVGSTTATMNGTVNANGDSSTVAFEFGLSNEYGSTIVASPNPISGSTATSVSATYSSFLPNTTYHYRVSATNTNGTSYGSDMTFTTLPSAPTATTNTATAIGTTTATLNGTVNANDGNTTVTFQYGLTAGYGTTVTATQSPVTGSTDTGVSRALTGLTNGATYHYRVVATNAGGTTYGADMTFTTGTTPPTATTNAATGVAGSNATLNGTVNANGSSTTVTFEYGETTSYGRTVNASPNTVTGSTNNAVSVALTNLNSNATYHFRVKAVNSGGTTYGADMTFVTGSGPSVTTSAASAVGINVATLNGIVNANNDSTTVTFEYGTTTAYGSTVTAPQSPVSGATETAVSIALSSLSASTTYHYRCVGQNSGGTTNGADMTFVTQAADPRSPSATTSAAGGLTNTTATLNGMVDPKGYVTTITFEYGLTTAYGTTVTAQQSPLTDGIDTLVSYNLTGLTSNTTYHYRVVAQNSYGTTYGADMTFYTTAGTAPTATTDAASNVGHDSATLNATVDSNNTPSTIYFQYGLTTGYGSNTFADQSPIFGPDPTPVTLSISGLTANTQYHYRVMVQSSFGVIFGTDMTFTTSAAPATPTATTDAASAVGTTTATLNGTVNANNNSTTVTFEYGLNTSYGNTVTADQSPVTGSTNTAVSHIVAGIHPNTTYHFRVVAQSSGGTVYGTDTTFTTGTLPPTVDTNAPSALTSTGATLNGTVNANYDSTTVTFEYGTTISYGTTVTAPQSPVTGGVNTAVNYALTGLTNSTTYHYRVVGQNSAGTTYGADMTFFTGAAAPTAATGAATNIGTTSATLNGTVNANNSSTTVTFEYGETIGYGRSVTADQSPVTGSTNTAVSLTQNDLLPDTTYHYRVVGQNATGTTQGADMTFTTNVGGSATVTTANVTNIGATSATCGGNVTDEGGTSVTARGVCWSTTATPTLSDSFTSNGTGAGVFTSSLTGLSESTTYYVRAYATNVYGTVYGDEYSFTTNSGSTPTVTTTTVTDITGDSATSGGNVTNAGDSTVTARGVCWSTAPNPTIDNNRTTDGSGIGVFISNIINLTKNTTYYVRAYATNAYGTGYGSEIQFTTGDSSAVINVTITEPGEGDVVSGTVTISVSASVSYADTSQKSASITKVVFYIDNAKIDEVTAAPYETTWNSVTSIDGIHTIKAIAYDQNNNSEQDEIWVTLQNTPALPPNLVLNKDNLIFGAEQDNSNGDKQNGSELKTSAQTVLVDNSGGGILNWSLSFTSDWISCTPAFGSGAAAVDINVLPSNLSPGTYTDTITFINLNNPDNTEVIPVTLIVYNTGSTTEPFGYFCTPPENAVVAGNVPVTGWALDDIEVDNVRIYYTYSSNGSGMSDLVYVGKATFVDGARPDVEALYPDLPLNSRAGWGYMMLTNVLPNGGNGTFTIYAKLEDKEGNEVMLGGKTITCNNANSVKPFGTIDTPAPGETINGSSYKNYGWALTPLPNTIPFSGSTILVWVDGMPLGSPVYNKYRSDVAGLFPDYNNSNGAGGVFAFDTTQYTNGLHTIAWSVIDDAGNRDGIGSRFFTIINEGVKNQRRQSLSPKMDMETLFNMGNANTAIHLQKGFDINSPIEILYPDMDGTVRIDIQEVQRFELAFETDLQSMYDGYILNNKKLQQLPTGSFLDKQTGHFYWHPGPSYVGDYILVFVKTNPSGDREKILVKVTINSKFEQNISN